MKGFAARSRVVTVVLGLVAFSILLLPFHAFLSVWAASNFGHYTLIRLWKEFLVAICGLIVIGWFVSDKKVRAGILASKLIWLILAYAAFDLLLGLIDHQAHKVSLKALAYGLLDDLRFLAFFVICWATAIKSRALNRRWEKLILWPAAIVVAFGLLQMSVLPKDVLVHFGYGAQTIPPYATINNNAHYVRIISTLRGADPLGAYLILPIAALTALLVSFPKSWRWLKLLFLAAAATVLFGSYSRGAWIGAAVAVLVVLAVSLNRLGLRRYKLSLAVGGVVVAVLIAGAFGLLGTNKRFENIVFHTQTNSSSPVGSDEEHLSAVTSSLREVAHEPLGEGPGTSGPASVYNHDRPPRIPEDYFLEVGEESGWLGLALFMAINIWVGCLLWQRRRSPFATALLAALIGITFVNLLTLAWTDDTLSYIWWGLAGLSVAIPPAGTTAPQPKARTKTKSLAKGVLADAG